MFNEGGDRPVVPGTQLDGPNLASEHATFRPALSKDERDRRGKGGRRNPGRRVQDPADLAKRVNDLAATLADITSALTGAPAEPAAKVDLAKTVKRGKAVVGQIDEALRSGESLPVDVADLKSVMDDLLRSVQRSGAEQVIRAANEVVRDPTSLKILRKLADGAPQLTEVADQVTEKITPSAGAARPALGTLVLAGALLLAAVGAGVVIPLLAPTAIAESVLTNEVAIAAVAVGVAALIKRR